MKQGEMSLDSNQVMYFSIVSFTCPLLKKIKILHEGFANATIKKPIVLHSFYFLKKKTFPVSTKDIFIIIFT